MNEIPREGKPDDLDLFIATSENTSHRTAGRDKFVAGLFTYGRGGYDPPRRRIVSSRRLFHAVGKRSRFISRRFENVSGCLTSSFVFRSRKSVGGLIHDRRIRNPYFRSQDNERRRTCSRGRIVDLSPTVSSPRTVVLQLSHQTSILRSLPTT